MHSAYSFTLIESELNLELYDYENVSGFTLL